jgi:hypothetical protein
MGRFASITILICPIKRNREKPKIIIRFLKKKNRVSKKIRAMKNKYIIRVLKNKYNIQVSKTNNNYTLCKKIIILRFT